MQCMATASQGAGVVVQRGIEYDVEVDFSASEGTTANLLCIFSFSFSFSILLFFLVGGGRNSTVHCPARLSRGCTLLSKCMLTLAVPWRHGKHKLKAEQIQKCWLNGQ